MDLSLRPVPTVLASLPCWTVCRIVSQINLSCLNCIFRVFFQSKGTSNQDSMIAKSNSFVELLMKHGWPVVLCFMLSLMSLEDIRAVR